MDKAVYEKLCHYCVYSERCRHDVELKLTALKVAKEERAVYIARLLRDNFLNEKRYVKFFVEAKLRRKWGMAKIRSALAAKGIKEEYIAEQLGAIDLAEYEEKMLALAHKKYQSLKDADARIRKQKTLRFLLSKGYESVLAMKVLKQL